MNGHARCKFIFKVKASIILEILKDNKPFSSIYQIVIPFFFLICLIEIAAVYLNNDLIRAHLSASSLYLLGIQDSWPHCTPITESLPKQPKRPARQMRASFVICRAAELVGPWLFCFIRMASLDSVNHQHVQRTLKTCKLYKRS